MCLVLTSSFLGGRTWFDGGGSLHVVLPESLPLAEFILGGTQFTLLEHVKGSLLRFPLPSQALPF